MREADIRPADLLAEYLRLSSEDARSFFPSPSTFVARRCPACDADGRNLAFVKEGFQFCRCRACNTLYAAPVPPLEQLAAFYRKGASQKYWAETFFPAVAEARRTHVFQPRVARIADMAREHGMSVERLIDVGAGAGVFLEEAKRGGMGGISLRAVEPNEAFAEPLRARGFETFVGFVEEAAGEAGWVGTADLVTTFEVIEHLIDPLAFLRAVRGLARPGGMVVLTGLCGDGFDIITLGASSKAVAPPHHLTFLSRRGVAALLERAGLEQIAFLTPGQLDVDIVRNTLNADSGASSDPFTHSIALEAPESTRIAFQNFLAEHRLSSHMWIVARRPL